jgi:hypothetical protein
MKVRRTFSTGLPAGFFLLLALPFLLLSLHGTMGSDSLSSALFSIKAAYAEEAWKKEFDDVCSKTTDSMALDTVALTALIARCDKLKPVIESLEESPRKVYGKRLEGCRNLLVFVLEFKKSEVK